MGHFDNIIIRPQTGEVAGTGVGTIYQDLPEKGFLSTLMVDLAAVVEHGTDPGLDIWNVFTKFEVLVDGSKVVKSYDAKQLRALAHYWGMDLSQLGWYARHDTSGDKTWWNFPILFGRFPGDKEYMLDMDRYSNPQLRITYNADQILVDGAGYHATDDPYVRSAVQGLIWRGGAPPDLKGYIKSTEIDSWKVHASMTRQVEIPKGNDLIGFMQGARCLNDKMLDFIEHMELTFDNGEWQVYDHGYQELKSLEAMWFPRAVQARVRKDFISGDDLDLCMGVCNHFGAFSSAVEPYSIIPAHEGTWNIQPITITKDGDADETVKHSYDFYMSGQFPHQNMYIPMHKYSDDDAFGIDTKKYGRIDIKTTTGEGATETANLQTVAEFVVPTGE